MLPNFLIVGPPKSGTTSLQIYLSKHEDIFIPNPGREIHFFDSDENFEKGIEWYESFFKGWKGEKAIGEKTPAYFYYEKVPERVREVIPDVKLIFIFRNPIDRAYSNYWHNVRTCREDESFESAIDRELRGEEEDIDKRYLYISEYITHLRRWKKFFPRDQMFFLILEDLNQDIIKNLFRFLDVDEKVNLGEFRKHNIGGMPRSMLLSKISQNQIIKNIPLASDFINRIINMKRGNDPPMKKETRVFLQNYFKPYNQELERFTGLDLKIWER